jgi:hypothetical protein
MNKALAIQYLFPKAINFQDFIVEESDGVQTITYWGLSDPIPTDEQLQVAWDKCKDIAPPPTQEERISQLETFILQSNGAI